VQNWERSKGRTFIVVILFYFEGKTHFNAKNELDKDVTVRGSYYAEDSGRSPQSPEANGGLVIFTVFSKKYAFLSI